MENQFSNVPLWVSLLFAPTFPITIYFITEIIKKGSIQAQLSENQANKIQTGIWMFFTLYFSYTLLLSYSGFLGVNVLPPRVFIFIVIPFMIFLFGFVYGKPLYWKILDSIPLVSLVKIHIFRFVGTFFLIAAYYKALPQNFALLAGFGDILTAVGAFFVSKWIVENKPWHKKATLIWNIFGFWDIVSVIISVLITTKNSIETNSQSVIEITKIPFVLIPAFAPAVIIFLHISIFKKLKRI
jgi:uncharacterized membrane protein (DUF485 family)